MKRDPATRMFQPQLIKGPVDFYGIYKPTCEAIVFDAKASANPKRFPVGSDVTEAQCVELIRYGVEQAHAGLLVESTATRWFYWINWSDLLNRPPSFEWTDGRLAPIGPNNRAINWRTIAEQRKRIPSRLFRS